MHGMAARACRAQFVKLPPLLYGADCLIGRHVDDSDGVSLWLIYHLSASAFLLGVIGFASQVPIAFLSPAGGVLADRFDRLTPAKNHANPLRPAIVCHGGPSVLGMDE